MLTPGVKIGPVTFVADQPRVIAPFTDKTPIEEIVRLRDVGLDLLEARVDCFDSYETGYVLDKLAQVPANLPVVATIRSQREGGKWRGSETERLSLFSALMPQVDGVDIELSSSEISAKVAERAKKAKRTLIISFHDFRATPSLEVLVGQVDSAKKQGADIAKIATTSLSIKDTQTLASLTIAKARENLIVLGMGPEGLKTRLLFPALGSLMTFAYIDRPSAPGQLSVQETLELIKVLYPGYSREKSE
jgi:3-dehydroquinate dehydratase-1